MNLLLLCLQAHLQSLLPRWVACPESVPLSRNLVHTLHLVGVAVAWRKGSRITEEEKIIKLVEKILSPAHSLSDSVLSVSLRLVTSLLLVSTTVTECRTHFSQLLWLLCVRGEGEEVRRVLECFRELAEKHPHFSTVSLPWYMYMHVNVVLFSLYCEGLPSALLINSGSFFI